MNKYGRSAVSEFLGDNIIYRNLIPVDPGLPALPDIWEQVGLQSSRVPRKTTPEYARVIVHILQHISHHSRPRSAIKRVVFIGDTLLNDGTAFLNICQAGDWSGMAFIAAERDAPVQSEVEEKQSCRIFSTNRWSALAEFKDYCKLQKFPIEDQTTVLLDLDKTTLGARGRNDQVIDQVRIEAANQTIRELLGDDYDEQVFTTAYQRLNHSEFHPFTTDNQDYLVYICMILGSGLITLEELLDEMRGKKISSFAQFLRFSEDHKEELPLNLRRVHDDVFALVNQGDPTPFKEFRHQEFKLTVSHMGQLGADTPVEELLKREITITQEVRQAALNWREQGALLFGLSDKPDEASIPSAELASQDYQAIHCVETDIVGE
jgi:hypothetical protein